MSAEPAVVNLFLIFRVFLVGTIFFIFPRIARKGLVFGIYVGEARAEGDVARSLLRSWDRGIALVMTLSLLVGLGISLAGWPVPGNFTGTAVLLLILPLQYLRIYRKARKLAPPDAARQAKRATALIAVDESRGDGFAKLALAICLLTALGTVAFATVRYETLPDRVPTFSSLLGITDELSDKSINVVLFVPSLNLVFSSAFALVAVLMARAKRSVRGGSGGRSAEAQDAFRIVMSQTLSGSALFICLLLTFLSVQMIRIALSQTQSLGVGMGLVAGAMLVFMLASLIRIFRHYGQGGALLEEGSVDAPLTGGLADNAHWILGMIYVDKEDPSILVESRFGIGYTMNLGNRTAVLIIGTFLVLILGLVVLALTA